MQSPWPFTDQVASRNPEDGDERQKRASVGGADVA